MKKLIILISILIITFFIFILITFIPKNYSFTYKLQDFSVNETYIKSKKIYKFIIKNSDNIFEYNISSKYYRSRGLINNLILNEYCLNAKSKQLNSFTICKENDEYITKFYNSTYDDKIIKTYENINIYNLLNHTYYIWNYNNFIIIKNDATNTLSLFDTDFYKLELISKIDNYLLVADYNQKYTFDKLYLINSKNNKVKEIDLKEKIYFNSYILGTYKNNVYFYDLQEKLEYKINPFKEKITTNKLEILNNNKWESISSNKLNKKNIKFTNEQLFYYLIIDDFLYYINDNIKIKVCDMSVSNIIEYNTKEAYFIANDTMYYVDIDKGITKLLSYSEWNFNNSNIYIF